jgi:hypothetical protein
MTTGGVALEDDSEKANPEKQMEKADFSLRSE